MPVGSLTSSRHLTLLLFFFSFIDTATTEIYTLSLHDALPIATSGRDPPASQPSTATRNIARPRVTSGRSDRKSTRLNSSHRCISYAVFCLKKKTLIKTVQFHNPLGLVAEARRMISLGISNPAK